jgi:apolipoprotein N-acyltransferase
MPYQRASTPFISNVALAAVSGLLMVFSFPEWNLWSLGWVAAAPLIMAVAREQRFFRSFLLGLLAGTIFYTGSSHWITHSMNVYGGLALWLCYLITVLFSLVLAVFTGAFAATLAQAVRRFGGWAILAAPILWAASEWARIQITGMGWNQLGYSQAFQPAVIQVARLGGVYIVSAVLVSASTALVFAIIYLERKRGIIVLTAAGVLAALTILYGQWVRPADDAPGSVMVSVVQPYVPIDGPWEEEGYSERMTQMHISMSEHALAASQKEIASEQALGEENANGSKTVSNVRLFVWPESPMNFAYDRDEQLRRRIAQFTRRNNAYLLMNTWGFSKDSSDDRVQYNSAIVIGPDGDKIAEYDKIALVPFGEYVPARGWLPFASEIPALVADITPGTSFTLSDVGGARIGTAICFEATRPDIVREFRNEGASAIVQISNELWFGPTAAPRQMLAHAIFRAVENNIDLIRATNSGLSARVDRYGVVYGETPLMETASRTWRIKTVDEVSSNGVTVYTRYGDVFAVICAALSLILTIAAFIPAKPDDEG